jgi:hypothetical protein
MNKKPEIAPSDLVSLAKLAQTLEWQVLCRMMDNRIQVDKNLIMIYPEEEPMKLALWKKFYRGRISACVVIKNTVNNAGLELEKLETKEELKPKRK